MDYFEVPRPPKEGFCSDKNCPCHDTVIPPGEGYLYISQKLIDFRRDCFTYAQLQLKLKQMAESDPLNKLGAGSFVRFLPQGTTSPIMMCKQAAILRGLDLEVAQADAKYWWKTGLVPFRETPRLGDGSVDINQAEPITTKRTEGKKICAICNADIPEGVIQCVTCGGSRFNHIQEKTETKLTEETSNNNCNNHFGVKGFRYRNRKYGFSIDLPEGWKQEKKLFDFFHNSSDILLENKKDNLNIRLRISIKEINRTTPYSKEYEEHSMLKWLEETISSMNVKASPVLLDKNIAGEKNTVWGEFRYTDDLGSTDLFGIVSVANNGLKYIIRYFIDAETESNIKEIIDTFQFISSQINNPNSASKKQNSQTINSALNISFLYRLQLYSGQLRGIPVKMYVFRQFVLSSSETAGELVLAIAQALQRKFTITVPDAEYNICKPMEVIENPKDPNAFFGGRAHAAYFMLKNCAGELLSGVDAGTHDLLWIAFEDNRGSRGMVYIFTKI
ncbi:MAG: hypothetical protein WC330_03780 [Candidatus Omnitrophota bacterium]|jgi:ribosomal protein L40E